MDKIKKLKEIVQEIDVIPYWNENPTSSTLKKIINKQKEILENNNLEETKITKLAEQLKYRIQVLIDKTPHITNEKEKIKYKEIAESLEKLIYKEK